MLVIDLIVAQLAQRCKRINSGNFLILLSLPEQRTTITLDKSGKCGDGLQSHQSDSVFGKCIKYAGVFSRPYLLTDDPKTNIFKTMRNIGNVMQQEVGGGGNSPVPQ